ncbi:hypothetical protein RHGRI_028380 [Rhododendron griersonianum]|uniref:Uncharacterized protein n=1 Tax=Rhododendron griersonianum TaxID=479676 RepID=A0AAV6ILL0_9ERIC|nr:hypothetical protein RHGRI_028380 [Rhododendron griersonianum]
MREVSYAKGRVLIATEISNKIEGEVQLSVNGRNYFVQVVEEETFRSIVSTVHGVVSEAKVQDDDVDNTGDDRDASCKKDGNLVDDMERQRKVYPDDKVEEAEKFEEAEMAEKSNNYSHQPVLGKKPNVEKPPLQEETVGDMAQGNNNSDERINEESSNSVHGLDSIVQDSQSPLNEECFESINNSSQVQNTEFHEQVQERERINEEAIIPVVVLVLQHALQPPQEAVGVQPEYGPNCNRGMSLSMVSDNGNKAEWLDRSSEYSSSTSLQS